MSHLKDKDWVELLWECGCTVTIQARLCSSDKDIPIARIQASEKLKAIGDSSMSDTFLTFAYGSSAQTQVQWVHVQPQHAQSRHEYSWALRTSGGWSLLCGYAAAGAGMGPRVAEQRLQQVDAADVTCQKCRSPWAECSADRCLACRHASPISPLQANDSSQSYGDLSGQRQEERKPWLLACLLSAFAGWSWCFSVPILIVACCPCSLPFPAAWTKSMSLKLFGNSQTRGPSSQQSSFE